MKLHYMGKFDLNPESLPHGDHQPGAVPFQEAQDTKALGLLANVLAAILFIPLAILLYLRFGSILFSIGHMMLAFVLSLLALFPHEVLHALCFREDVYLYTNLKQGLLFVVGPETMSKGRFIWMSMLPNIVFGIIPYIIGMISPSYVFLGIFGALLISMGCGDYYNIFNAITQMPKGTRTYLYQFHSFWYIPQS